MVGFLLLRLFLMFIILPIVLLVLSLSLFKKKKTLVGEMVMIPDGRHGRVIEIVKYEDMPTLYGIRIENEIVHLERDKLILRNEK